MTLAQTFPITTAALKRLRRSWHRYWAGYHLFCAIEHFETIGDDEAANETRRALINGLRP